MWSRNENDITVAWPELQHQPAGRRDLLVDGEVVALNERGLPDFRALPGADARRRAQTAARLAERGPGDSTWSSTCSASTARPDRRAARDPPGAARPGSGSTATVAGARVVRRRADALRRDAPAGAGGHRQQAPDLAATPSAQRSQDWLKFAHRRRLSYVVGGWRPARGHARPARRGARGRADRRRAALPWPGRQRASRPKAEPAPSRELARRPRPAPTARSPTRCRASTPWARHWVEPVLVVDVETHGSRAGPPPPAVVQGVRADLTPEDLHRRPAPLPGAAGRRCSLVLLARRRSRGPAVAPSPATGRRPGGDAASRSAASTVTLRRGTTQVVTVNHTPRLPRPGHASGCARRRLGARARTSATAGSGTAGWWPAPSASQGSGTTPLGTVRLISAFGTPRRARRLGPRLPQDPAGRLLGRGQRVGRTTTATATRRQGGFRWRLPPSDPNSSERLATSRSSTSTRSSPVQLRSPGAPPRRRHLPARQRRAARPPAA